MATAGTNAAAGEPSGGGAIRRLANLRPWPPGVSGNPAGRPRRGEYGAKLAALERLGADPRKLAANAIRDARRGNVAALALVLGGPASEQ